MREDGILDNIVGEAEEGVLLLSYWREFEGYEGAGVNGGAGDEGVGFYGEEVGRRGHCGR